MSLSRLGIERYRRHVIEGRIKIGLDAMAVAMAMVDDGTSEPDCKILYSDASRNERARYSIADGGVLGFGVVWKQPLEARLARFGTEAEQEWEWYHTSRPILVKADMDLAEGEAVLVALQKGEELYQGETPGTIVVYTDNPSVLENVESPRFTLTGFINDETIYGRIVIRAVQLVDRGFTVELCHVPGHGGVVGNKLADYWSRYEAYVRHGYQLTSVHSQDSQGRHEAQRIVRARDRRREDLRQKADKAEAEERRNTERDREREREQELDRVWARFCEEYAATDKLGE